MPLQSSFAQSAHTLPRNFTFHYQDGEPPRTPEPMDRVMPQRSSPPPMPPARALREPYRLRRRRAPIQAAQRAIRAFHRDDVASDNQDIALPSIELTDSTGLPANLPPLNMPKRYWSPPKTPIAQIYEAAGTQEAFSSQEDLTRPSTACSGFSNSSKSSSVESFPSFGGGSCASPQSEADPFAAAISSFGLISSPLQDHGFQMTSAPQRQSWSKDMDDHLWLTYMRYLQDPTHTPFKMLPGTAPPPGVCSRVVREAKKTWKGASTSAIPRAYRFARWGSNRIAESTTNTANAISDRRIQPWPRSDSATRKRLRELCKLKPTLAPHYGRLLHARSPSPFLSSSNTSTVRDLSPRPVASAFSTRGMNISLATSVSATMQPGHPINQLSSEVLPEVNPAPTVEFCLPPETVTPRPRATTHQQFPNNPRTPSHQKSQSVQEGFCFGSHKPLASPFQPIPSLTNTQPQRSHDFLQTIVAETPTGPSYPAGSSLAAPVELHAPVPRRSYFKRPAPTELNDMINPEDPYTRQNHLMRELFGPPQPIEVSHRRVRSRGFSLGDMTASSRLESLFAGPSQEPVPTTTNTNTHSRSSSLLPPASINSVMRLGSPFSAKPAIKTFNTFPRNFSLIGLEPAMEISEIDLPDESMPNAP